MNTQTVNARTRAEWLGLVRSYTSGGSAERAEAVADYLVANPDSCVWHAAAVVGGYVGRCNCQPCSLARKVAQAS